jgi:two-component system, NtrC family, sensor kinase
MTPVDSSSSAPLRVVIIGAGTGGAALLELFGHDQGVEVLGIADIDPDAPGLQIAKHMGIPTTSDARELLARTNPELIVNATNDPSIEGLLQNKPPGAEVLGNVAARLMWKLGQHERELRDHLIQTEKMATIGTLVAGISHEINNPLYIMLGFSEHLRDEPRGEAVREYVDAISDAGQRIATIVRDLNTFAQRVRPEALGEVDINQTLDQAVNMARRAILNDVTIVTHYDALPSLHGKREEMLQVFLNLVTNALQAMEGHGTLTVTTRSSDGYILVTVKDTGPGIPSDHLPRVFDPFFTTKEPGKGPGLGLHIVREIVRGYGGKVNVESTLGDGAAFTVTLPSGTGSSPLTRSGDSVTETAAQFPQAGNR